MSTIDERSVGYFSTTLRNSLLDSSLIVATTGSELYNVKLVSCGNYVQVYHLSEKKVKKKKSDDKRSIKFVNTDNLRKIDNDSVNNNIEFKNIIRSKLECQRLAKANSSEWETFITLTFQENIQDIDMANKRLKYFVDKVRRVYKDFKYICIPEFQKRGAVHYHLLTNIKDNDQRLIYCQEDNHKFKHIKYWNEGFTKVDSLEKDIKKIIGYISKYMTKDADNRLYNRHRYLCSRNLIKPKISYLNLDNPTHLEFLKNKLNNKELQYENIYKNFYNDDLINFKEYL